MIEASWNLAPEIYPSVVTPKSVRIELRNTGETIEKFTSGFGWLDARGALLGDALGAYSWCISSITNGTFELYGAHPLGFHPWLPSAYAISSLPSQAACLEFTLNPGESWAGTGPTNGDLPLCGGVYFALLIVKPVIGGYPLLQSYVHYVGETPPTPTPPSLIEQIMPIFVVGLMAAIVIPLSRG
jgi:hypothetical protein